MARRDTSSTFAIPTPVAGRPARYGVAIGSTLLALAVTLLIRPFVESTIFIFFFASLAISAWYGGFGPGLVASVLAVLLVDYYVILPAGTLRLHDPADILPLAVFLAVGTLISRLTGSLRRARARSEQRREEAEALAQQLQDQAVELEQQTEQSQSLAEELEATNEDLRRSVAEADAANRAKSDFLTVMSHELRTPLNAIAGYSELLELGVHGELTPAQLEAVRRIRRSEHHLLSLINDVLNFARLDAGSVSFHITNVPVVDLFGGLDALIGPQLQARRVELAIEIEDESLAVHADAEKARQILLNLLSNAMKVTEPGGRISLHAAPAGDRVLLSVRDTGRGIPADQLARIFEPFVQLERTLTSGHEGVGLGLAISRDLARGMGGELGVESEPGHGSAFTLSLARAAIAAHRALEPAHRPHPSALPRSPE